MITPRQGLRHQRSAMCVRTYRDVAQLVAHMLWEHGVGSSSLLIPTKERLEVFLFFVSRCPYVCKNNLNMKTFEFSKGILTIGEFKFKLEDEDVQQISSLISDIILKRYVTRDHRKPIEPEIQEKLQLKLSTLIHSEEDDTYKRGRKNRILNILSKKITDRYYSGIDLKVGDLVQLPCIECLKGHGLGKNSIDLVNGVIFGLGLRFGMKIEEDENNNLYYYQEK